MPEERNYLREWREFKRMTQEQLADRIGTTKAVISLLESEKRPLHSTWLRKLADVFGTTPGRILDIDPNKVDAKMLAAWDKSSPEDRERMVRIIESLSGTND